MLSGYITTTPKKMKTSLIVLLLITRTALSALVYETKVAFRNDAPGEEFYTSSGSLLDAGTPAPGDGAVLQFGFYSGATHNAPFAGNFIPLTGPGSIHGWSSTLGDGPGATAVRPAGQFFSSVFFDLFTDTTNDDLPIPGVPMAIRFYNGTTIAGSTEFNTVSNVSGAWDWHSTIGGSDHAFADLSAPGLLLWERGPTTAFHTEAIVPEPSSTALLIVATVLVAARRKKSAASPSPR